MISGRIRERLIELHSELNITKDPELYDLLIQEATDDIFNLVNCKQKVFFPDNEDNLS